MESAVESESHRLHLRSFVRAERKPAYARCDYLSREWQLGLWKDEVGEATGMQVLRQSPSSINGIDSDAAFGLSDDASACVAPEAPSEICAQWREKIVEWKYQVVDRFDLDREIVSISTFYLDRYLSTRYVNEELFQLVAMTSIYLAIKIHSPKMITIRSIISTGNGLIRAEHIEVMELSIMKSLDWHLFPPTSAGFIENFFPLISHRIGVERADRSKYNDALEFSRFLTELSACAYPFVSAKPSSVALAAMLYAFEYFRIHDSTSESLRKLASGLDLDARSEEVKACGTLLRRMHLLAMPNYNAW